MSKKSAVRARVVTFTNQKGGVAKSTSAEAFAAGLTRRGYSVLMVDMDAQPGNMSQHVGGNKDLAGVYEFLSQRKPNADRWREFIQPTKSFGDLMCADTNLDTIDRTLSDRSMREFVLYKMLAPVLDCYDFVVIDTPPALQLRTVNAIVAADDVIVPTMADSSSVIGMNDLFAKIEELAEDTAEVRELHDQEPIAVAGVIVTKLDTRNKLEPELLETVRAVCDAHEVPLLEPAVRHTVSVKRAQRYAIALSEAYPDSTASKDYDALVDCYLRSLQG